MDGAATRPLDGILVLDLTQMAAGPAVTMQLADAGASVIKIERPGSGDPSRGLPPFRVNEAGEKVAAGILRFGRNKRSLALDLAADEGKAVFRELVRKADVLWENFVVGSMDRLGLGYESLREINPRLIYGAISGFGHRDSPDRDRAALDLVAQAESGVMAISGDEDGPPAQVGAIIGDLVPALYGTIATLEALLLRARTGTGTMIDISLVDSLIAMNERAILAELLTGTPITRGRLGHGGPYRRFRTRDGDVVIAATIPSLWQRLCRAIEREDLLPQAPAPDPTGVWWRFGELLEPVLRAWTSERTSEEVLTALRRHEVPAAAVVSPLQAATSAHARARRMLLEGSHAVAGSFQVVGTPIKMAGQPEPETRPVPRLGEHSAEILRQILGYDDERITGLRARKIIA